VPATRYEILLPLKYNDGTEVKLAKFLLTKKELVARFGALTFDPHPVRGVWIFEGAEYEDALLKYVVVVDADTPEVQEFFARLKEILKARFRQIEVWIVASPVRII